MKVIKKNIIALVLIVVTTFSMSGNAFAAEVASTDEPYLIINGEKVVHAYQDYENKATGEYIHWNNSPNARSLAKSFDFKIRYSVKSSKFKVNSSSVTVSTDAHVEDLDGNYLSGYSGHGYEVDLNGVYTRSLSFAIDGTTYGTISGLKKGGSYSVTVINNDYLSDTCFLVGSGTITNN